MYTIVMLWLFLVVAVGAFPLFSAVLAAGGAASCFIKEPHAKPLTAQEVGKTVGHTLIVFLIVAACWAIMLAIED